VNFTPPTEEVTISADQFTWTVRERVGIGDVTPLNLSLSQGDEAIFRFTPLSDAVLSRVKELVLNTGTSSSVARAIPVQLWNWKLGDWEDFDLPISETYSIRNPARFLGPQNSVEIRIIGDQIAGFTRIEQLTVEQVGAF